MIIYFSGTGNSEYIAKLISKRLDDEIVNAAQMIKEERLGNFKSEKPYVFVAPTYAWRLPRVFEEFIKNSSLDGSKTAYYILTCGSDIGAANNYTKRLSRKLGFEHMGTAKVVMPENYLVMFEPTKEHDDELIIRVATKKTTKICKQILSNEPIKEAKISFIGHLQSGIVNSSFYTFYIGDRKFYATDSCISCGECADSCMLNNINLKDGQPIWGRNCTHCMACICKCPCDAIEYGKNTKGRRRYTFEKSRYNQDDNEG